jgi:AraC-like DNA-binding protein
MDSSHDRTSELLAPSSETIAIDPLSDVLRTVRLTGALFFLLECTTPWVDEIPEANTFSPILLPGSQQLISYHIVTQGQCWGGLKDSPPVLLEAGDVLLLPHGDPYFLSSAPDLRSNLPVEFAVTFFRQMAAGELPFVLTEGGGGPVAAKLICGFLGCDARPFNPVLAALPRLVHLRHVAGTSAERLGHLIDFAISESQEKRSGGQCVLLRLSELMFVEVVRRYVESISTEQNDGWLAGLRDPIIGRTLELLHHRAADPWTLEKLANAVACSRSTLAERFTSYVGQAPMHYLTRWRMQLAARMLSDGTAKVSDISLRVGYESEAAFSRAFKRIIGVAPAIWRKTSLYKSRSGNY